MRYFRTLMAAGVAMALTGGAVLATTGSHNPPQTVDASDVVASNVGDDTDVRDRVIGEPAQGTTDEAAGSEDSGSEVSFGSVHDVISAGGQVDPPSGADPEEPIGGVTTNGLAPAGIDLTSFPGDAPAETPFEGPDGFSVGPGCHVQCITSGVAYPRGFGAELVVKTTVDADLFVSVIADADGDGEWEFSEFAWSDGKVDDFRWALDHLDPGQKYYAMVAATDENDRTAHAFGEFTTLSQRDIYVSLGEVTVEGGPANVSETSLWVEVDGDSSNHTPGEAGIPIYLDVDRQLDLGLLVIRRWNDDVCEAWQLHESDPAQGHSSDACLAWHHASVDDLDLDTTPAGQTRWTETAVHATIQTPTGAGGALPPGYGDPYYFSFSAPVTVHVTYR